MEDWLLSEPILWLAVGGLAALALWRMSGFRKRRLQRRLTRLQIQVRRESNPRKRQELLQRWQELGGPRAARHTLSRQSARSKGQKARMEGRPGSSNPFGTRWWGEGRSWRKGWKSVERNIRWIENHRG